MGSSDVQPAQRARTKTPDFSELFRSAHGSRHSPRTDAAATGSSPLAAAAPSPGEKPTVTKARRSMLPFLGRRKPAEQTAAPPPPAFSKSANVVYPVNPVNTVRRSFGNGHAVLMITPPSAGPPPGPPVPSALPSMDVSAPSLGSKFAAHFTPLRSPSKNNQARYSLQKPTPPAPSSTLSPPVAEVRAPSIESQHSSIHSRSTTPRPLRGLRSSIPQSGDEEDFSDLFTLPNQLKKPQQFPSNSSTTSVHINLGDHPKKSGELSPTTPTTPSGPYLQFPIPPSTIIPPPSALAEKGFPRDSAEEASVSSLRSRSPSKVSSKVMRLRTSHLVVDSGSSRKPYSDFPSEDEGRKSHKRTTSVSESDTDASRANDSSYSSGSVKRFSKPSSMKPTAAGLAKALNCPPPSEPLPSPPFSPGSGGLGHCSATNTQPSGLPISPRPRANTLSITTNLMAPVHSLPKSNLSSPPRSSRANAAILPDATADELREALSQQRRKNSQLQDYIVTITKRYEDDRMTMTKSIEKLERNVRKKMREIEGLRWLVIHNGGVSDIDAAANLARSSLSTQDGDASKVGRVPSPSRSCLAVYGALPQADGLESSQSMPGVSITVTASSSALEVPSDATSTAASESTSCSHPMPASLTAGTLSVIPERLGSISRAERQKQKEERRASRALRRISASSTTTISSVIDPKAEPSATDKSLDPNFDPKRSMHEVLEKLRPFGH